MMFYSGYELTADYKENIINLENRELSYKNYQYIFPTLSFGYRF